MAARVLIAILALCGTVEAQHPLEIHPWYFRAYYGNGSGTNVVVPNLLSPVVPVDPMSYYIPGIGGIPAVSTADALGMDGTYNLQPTKVGSNLYFWAVSPDHPTSSGWVDGQNFKGGYSTDPRFLPAMFTNILMSYNAISQTLNTSNNSFGVYQFPSVFFDSVSNHYEFLAEGQAISGSWQIQHDEGGAWTANAATALTNGLWTLYGVVITNFNFNAWSSLGVPFNFGTNWWYVGLGSNTTSFLVTASGVSAAVTYQSTSGSLGPYNPIAGVGATTNSADGGTIQVVTGGDTFFYNGQMCRVGVEDCRRGALVTTNGSYTTNQGMGPVIYACDFSNTFGVLPTFPAVRLEWFSNAWFPGPSYVQNVSSRIEDGVLYWYAERGFFPNGLTGSTGIGPFTNGGGNGLQQEFTDFGSFVISNSVASNAAPFGVQASCSNGTVTVSWLNGLPNCSYRVYRSTNQTGPTWTQVAANISTTTFVDNPPMGTNYWYEVVHLNNGVETQNRICSVFCGLGAPLANLHVSRSLNDGAAMSTLQTNWLTNVVQWLAASNLTADLLAWPDIGFGVKSNGTIVNQIYDLGTTQLPRMADLTENTTIKVNAFNSRLPGWTGGTNAAVMGFRNNTPNQIRRKIQVTIGATTIPSGVNEYLWSYGDQVGADKSFQLSINAGGFAQIVYRDSTFVTNVSQTTVAAGVPHVIVGTFDGTNLNVFVDGVGSATNAVGNLANTNLASATPLKGYINATSVPVLGLYSSLMYNNNTGAYTVGPGSSAYTAMNAFMFDLALTSNQINGLQTLITNHITSQ